MAAVKNIAIIGRIGTGKSATGNTLCGRKIFKSNFSANSVTENFLSHEIQCEEHNTILRIIDTPGISGSTEHDNHFLIELKKVLNEYDSGIHAILVVLSLRESFTKAVQDSFAYFTSILGDSWEQFGILIFTNPDSLEDPLNAKQYIKKSKAFSKIRKLFGKKYFVVNNTKHCPKQLSQLYSLIVQTIDQNGSSVYTDARLTSAEMCRNEQGDMNAEMLLKRQFEDKWKTESMHMEEQHATNEQDLKREAKKHSSNTCSPVKEQETDSEDTISSNEEQDCPPIIKWLVLESNDSISTTKGITDTDDDKIAHNSPKVCSMCEVLSPNTFCEECKINLCIKCISLHDKILKSHKKGNISLKRKEKGIESNVCKLPAECSIKTECEEPKYICFHCDLVLCKNCFGPHQEKHDEHRVLDASQIRIIHRNHTETQNSNYPVLMVVLNLKKKISKCDLYFHPYVVCTKINEEKLDKYQLIKFHNMENMQNAQSLKVSEKCDILQAKLLHVIVKMKRDVKEILKKRLIFLQDEDILWVLFETSLLKEIILTTLSKYMNCIKG
ncbi:uncharacterized protein LOC127703867 isoform X2 [Mytilus californianus]|uniref:uncharacterized protein LOC127703867 isoform X2 n=1 Tax=Mytilus californianus TaxID=6549 RepID=UPI0022473720|nr:uncharacterized protein LOC127703867 isoform X2 [Mytilus californianus]